MKRALTISILCIVTAAVSCTKSARELSYAGQEAAIESFVQAQTESYPDARVVLNEGAVRLVMSEGDGVELNSRGKVTFYYAGYTFRRGTISNSDLIATNNKEFATGAKWALSDESCFEPLTADMSDTGLLEGLRKGLAGVKEGEECYILFSGKYAYGKDPVGTIPANTPLAFYIWVQSVEN